MIIEGKLEAYIIQYKDEVLQGKRKTIYANVTNLNVTLVKILSHLKIIILKPRILSIKLLF